MRTAGARAPVALAPADALGLWADVSRWHSFVEGFARTIELSGDWPAQRSKHVWESGAGGRGRVTELVVDSGAAMLSTDVFEQQLAGRQTVTFEPDAEGSVMELRLDYELTSANPLRALADVIFIRRALRDALRRSVRRFAVEAEDEAGLR